MQEALRQQEIELANQKLNQEQQAKLLRMISYNSEMSNGVMSTLKNSNEMVKAKPVGDKEYIYAPRQVGGNKVTEVSVKDINVNISGTIKLDGVWIEAKSINARLFIAWSTRQKRTNKNF